MSDGFLPFEKKQGVIFVQIEIKSSQVHAFIE
jgi:hypothetical protein